MTIEDKYFTKDPIQFAKSIFTGDWLFKPFDTNKPQSYYEQILVESDSAKFVHFTNNNSPTEALYSTLTILKVINYDEWGNTLLTPRKLQAKITDRPHTLSYNY